jgi:hypothetical protein
MKLLLKIYILIASGYLHKDFPREVPKLPVKYNQSQSTPSVCTSPTLGTLEYLRRRIVEDRANLP